MSSLRGNVDIIDEKRVVGWAQDEAAPGSRVLIEVSAGAETRTVVANLARRDLSDAGIGDGRHGFVAELDVGSTGADLVTVRVATTGEELAGSPFATSFVERVATSQNGDTLALLISEVQTARLALHGSRT